jgi:chromosome segregation ATPase
VLEDLENTTYDDIADFKTHYRTIFEKLCVNLEENNDIISALEHRVNYLQQDLESKDLHIEKITIAMQEEVDECRVEADDLIEEMTQKLSSEVSQRNDVESLVSRLQLENARLKVNSKLQKPLLRLLSECHSTPSNPWH